MYRFERDQFDDVQHVQLGALVAREGDRLLLETDHKEQHGSAHEVTIERLRSP